MLKKHDGFDGGRCLIVKFMQNSKGLKMKKDIDWNEPRIIGVLILILLLVIIGSVMMGRYFINIQNVFQTLFAAAKGEVPNTLKQYETIIFKVRLPRIFTALFIGSALSISGASYQSMFRNPMVSPDILGVSAGASFGAALGIILNCSYWEIQIMAFVFGLIAVSITYLISASAGKSSEKIVILVLSGLIIRTVFQAFLSIVKYLADSKDALPEITFWLMGSISSVTTRDAIIIGIPVIIGSVILLKYGWQLNVMSFGDEEAASMGIDAVLLRRKVIVISTVMVCVSISVCGTIGWVGLIIPHFARMIVGPDNKILLPVSVLLGGIYLLLMDDIARNLMQLEIPISILTSIIGAPVFVFLLIHSRRCW